MFEVLLIVATPALIVCVTMHTITMAVIRHRERMEKLRQGIDPDRELPPNVAP